MSIENYSLQRQAEISKPKLTMMLPDPTRYSPPSGGGGLHFGTQQSHLSQPPQLLEPKLSLPSIRELLHSSEHQQQPQTQPQLVQQQPQPQPQLLQQPQPQYQSQSQQQLPTPPQQFPAVELPRSQTFPQYSHQQVMFQHQQQSGRLSPSVLSLPQMPMAGDYHQPHGHILAPPPHHHHPHQQLDLQRPISATSMHSLPNLNSPTNSPNLIEEMKEVAGRKKRQNLPRQTTLILLNWLSDHLERPYPNSREKYELLMKTRLTIQQLDNWFINARRRKIHILKKLKESQQPISLTF